MLLIAIASVVLVLAVGVGCYRFHRVIQGARHWDTVPPQLPPGLKDPAIVVFSKTNGFRHKEAIGGASALILAIAERKGWLVFFTENGAVFNRDDLPRFRAVIWNNTSGDVLNSEQKEAFRSYIENGGGFVGIHGAGGDFRYAWRWYVETLIGAQFMGHTLFPQFPTATIRVEKHDDPATKQLPGQWRRSDEWYSFRTSPRAKGVTVLATLDESTYRPRMAWKDISMGPDHPVIWKHCVGKGRAFYSAIGHQASAYQEPNYRAVLEGGLVWAAGLDV